METNTNSAAVVIRDAIWTLTPSVAAVFMENQNNVARVNMRFYWTDSSEGGGSGRGDKTLSPHVCN